MKWINVEDKLPEFKKEVLCSWYECEGGISIGILDEVRHIQNGTVDYLEKDWTLYSSIGKMEYDVTHWMELPEVPKE